MTWFKMFVKLPTYQSDTKKPPIFLGGFCCLSRQSIVLWIVLVNWPSLALLIILAVVRQRRLGVSMQVAFIMQATCFKTGLGGLLRLCLKVG